MRNVTSISPSLYRCDFKAASQYSGISVRAVLTFQSKWSNFISVWQLSSALAKSYYVWHPRPLWFFTIRVWCFFGLLASSTGLILMSLLASQKKTDSFTLDKKKQKNGKAEKCGWCPWKYLPNLLCKCQKTCSALATDFFSELVVLLRCWQQGAWLRNLCEEHYVEPCVKILPKENIFRWRQHDGVGQHLPHGKNLNLL